METRKGVGSKFVVDLGSVKLPEVVEKRVESEIQAVVLRTLADTDFERSWFDKRRPFVDWIVDIPGQTAGLILNPDGAGGPVPLPLEPRDHTRVMQAVMEYPLHVARQFEKQEDSRPSGSQVLQAALNVEQIDDYTKSRIRAILEFLPQLEEDAKQLPDWLEGEVEVLRRQLQGRSIDEQVRILKSPGTMGFRHEESTRSLAAVVNMLEDGRDTIYSPDHPFHRMFSVGDVSARSAVTDTAAVDAIGGFVGGFFGSVIPVLGTSGGAYAGGAGASAGYAAGTAIMQN